MAQNAEKIGQPRLVPPQPYSMDCVVPTVTTIGTPVYGSERAETSGVWRPLPGSALCQDGFAQKTLSPPPPPPTNPINPYDGGSTTEPPLSRKVNVSPQAVVTVAPGCWRSFRIVVPPTAVACGATEGTPGAPTGEPTPLSPLSPVEKFTEIPFAEATSNVSSHEICSSGPESRSRSCS